MNSKLRIQKYLYIILGCTFFLNFVGCATNDEGNQAIVSEKDTVVEKSLIDRAMEETYTEEKVISEEFFEIGTKYNEFLQNTLSAVKSEDYLQLGMESEDLCTEGTIEEIKKEYLNANKDARVVCSTKSICFSSKNKQYLYIVKFQSENQETKDMYLLLREKAENMEILCSIYSTKEKPLEVGSYGYTCIAGGNEKTNEDLIYVFDYEDGISTDMLNDWEQYMEEKNLNISLCSQSDSTYDLVELENGVDNVQITKETIVDGLNEVYAQVFKDCGYDGCEVFFEEMEGYDECPGYGVVQFVYDDEGNRHNEVYGTDSKAKNGDLRAIELVYFGLSDNQKYLCYNIQEVIMDDQELESYRRLITTEVAYSLENGTVILSVDDYNLYDDLIGR